MNEPEFDIHEEAVREGARKQNATAYAAWIAETGGPDMTELDAITEEISLKGAEW